MPGRQPLYSAQFPNHRIIAFRAANEAEAIVRAARIGFPYASGPWNIIRPVPGYGVLVAELHRIDRFFYLRKGRVSW